MDTKYLAIDLGGTEIKSALMTKDGEILEKHKTPSPKLGESDQQDLLDTLKDVIDPYYSQISGVALSFPGILDSDTGHSFTGGSFYYLAGMNLPKMLQEKFNYDIPITVENDGKSAVLAEFWKGSLRGVENGAAICLGTAVGGGLILNGKIYKGNTFSAGELSFLLTNPKEMEFWGQTGGSKYLITEVAKKLEIDVNDLNGYKVFDMANAGNEDVLAVLDEYTKSLAYQLYNIQTLLDLDLLAIGGGISRQPLLIEYLRKNIQEFCDSHPIKPYMPLIPTPKIVACEFFNQSNLIGALYHHLKLTDKGDN